MIIAVKLLFNDFFFVRVFHSLIFPLHFVFCFNLFAIGKKSSRSANFVFMLQKTFMFMRDACAGRVIALRWGLREAHQSNHEARPLFTLEATRTG